MKISLLQKNRLIMKKAIPYWLLLLLLVIAFVALIIIANGETFMIRSPSGDIGIIVLFTLHGGCSSNIHFFLIFFRPSKSGACNITDQWVAISKKKIKET